MKYISIFISILIIFQQGCARVNNGKIIKDEKSNMNLTTRKPDLSTMTIFDGENYRIFINPETIYEGSLVQISVPFINKGTDYLGLNPQISIARPGDIVSVVNRVHSTNYEIKSGDLKRYDLFVTVGAAGTYDYLIKIDVDNVVDEESEINNSYLIELNVQQYLGGS